MLSSEQIISIALVSTPLLAGVSSMTGLFDLGFKDSRKRHEEIAKVLKERKIEDWKYVFGGDRVDGTNISLNNDHVSNVLRRIDEGVSLQSSLKLCKKSFHFYYTCLLAIFCGGVVYGSLSLIGWFSGLTSYIGLQKIPVIVGTLIFVVGGMIWLYIIKHKLEKKYEKYVGI